MFRKLTLLIFSIILVFSILIKSSSTEDEIGTTQILTSVETQTDPTTQFISIKSSSTEDETGTTQILTSIETQTDPTTQFISIKSSSTEDETGTTQILTSVETQNDTTQILEDSNLASTDKTEIITSTTTTTITTTSVSTTTTTKDKGSCKDGFFLENGECQFDFDRLSREALVKIVTKQMDSNALEDQISSRCSLSCPSNVDCSDLTGSVDWVYGKDDLEKTTELSFSNNEFYSYLGHNEWESAIGNKINCTLKLNYTNTTFEAVSKNYDLIMKCEIEGLSPLSDSNHYEISLNENEAETKRLKCLSTIPFACSNTSLSNCDLRFSLNYQNEMDTGKVVVTQCSKNSIGIYICNPKEKFFKPSNAWTPSDGELIWDIGVSVESKNKNFRDEIFELVLINNSTGLISSLFKQIDLVKITVKYKIFQRSLSYYATCYNDPHCQTFDQKPFELQQAGEYLMYENVETQTRVQVISTRCNPNFNPSYYPPPYCLNKIFIQYFFELVRIDVSKNILLYSDYSRNIVNQPVSFDRFGNVINDLNSIVIKKEGFGFEIITGYGLVLKIYGYVWSSELYMNRYDIIPAKGDFGKIDGLFGNWDGDSTNDLTKLKNDQASTNLTEIYNSYRVPANNIRSLETSFYPFNLTEIAYKHSFCALSTSDNRFSCAIGRNEDVLGFQKKISKRSADQSEDPIQILNSIGESNSFKKLLSLPAMQHAPRRFVRSIPDAEERNITCEKLKDKVPDELNEGINIDLVVNNCKLDNIIDPENDYINGYKNDVSQSAIQLATNDAVNMDTSSGKLIRKIPLQKLCPKNCSGNGQCQESGVCVCNTNFTGVDCSINELAVPEIVETTLTGIWNLSNGSLTDFIVKTKKFVSSKHEAKFKYSINYPNLNDQKSIGFINSTEISFNINFINVTKISGLSRDFYFLKITATNNDKDYSNEILVRAADLSRFSCNDITCSPIQSSEESIRKLNKIFVFMIPLICLLFKNF